jgi:hypothetical protein
MTNADKGHSVAEQVHWHQKDEAAREEKRARDIMFGAAGDLDDADRKWDRARANANITAIVVNKHRNDKK